MVSLTTTVTTTETMKSVQSHIRYVQILSHLLKQACNDSLPVTDGEEQRVDAEAEEGAAQSSSQTSTQVP